MIANASPPGCAGRALRVILRPMKLRSNCGTVSFLLPLTALLMALALLGACRPGQPEGAAVATDDAADSKSADDGFQRYEVVGEVLQLDAEKQTATIKHHEIVGWMDAMTMEFRVPDKAEWDKLSVGAHIRATLFVNDDGFHLGEIKLVQPDAAADGAPGATPGATN